MLQSILPQPRYTLEDADPTPTKPTPTPTSTSTFVPPPYGSRQNFVPRTIADFGDGGAFPEIHILQYPLDMGRKKGKSGTTSSALVNTATRTTQLQVDSEGHVKYDIVLRQGMRKDVLVQSKYEDMMEKDIDDPDVLAKPSAEEIAAQTAKPAAALSLIVDAKQSALMPTHIKKQESKEPVYIKYTPSNQDPAHNSGASQRIIRLQEMQVDPLEPPAFKHKRLPGGPPSPPVPIMHSPPRKITVQDQQNWKIPPCVSNWKNIKGYTIPLDKRLAADGRGYQEVQVNDKFAKLSESLVHAERIARTEIETRAAMLKRIKNQQKEAKEEELRNLAARARQAGRTASARDEDTYDAAANARAAAESSESENEEDIDERDQREQLRKERAREIKRDMRLEHKKDAKKQAKGMARDADRDVSEKIALGQTVAPSRDSMFDARLFNQSEGLGNTLGGNDAAYDIYDKALFKGSSANYIYRPKQQDDDMTAGSTDLNKLLEKNTAKFQPDRGFAGAQGMSQTTAAAVGSRDKPVEFERESDPFGIGSVLSDKNDSGRRSTALDSIGSRGHMSTSGGGASRSGDELGSSSRRMEFTESRERRRSRSRSRSRDRGDRGDRERRRERSRSRSPRRR